MIPKMTAINNGFLFAIRLTSQNIFT